MGPIHYYFESLQDFIERKADEMIEMFNIFSSSNCVKYLIIVLRSISMKFIDSISQNLISNEEDQYQIKEERFNHKVFASVWDIQKEKWMYIIDKITIINDILRAKTILQIHEYETSDNKEQLQNPNWILIISHRNLFEKIWNSIFEYCRDITEEMMINPSLAENRYFIYFKILIV